MMRAKPKIMLSLGAMAVMLLLAIPLFAATNHNHGNGNTDGANASAAHENGKLCELCEKPIPAKGEISLSSHSDGSLHHYRCVHCALLAARDWIKGDVTVKARSAGRGAQVEWSRRAGRWEASPASAVVLSLPEHSGDCLQGHLAFKEAGEFTSYAKKHPAVSGHRPIPATKVDAILLAGRAPAPKATKCPVMGNVVQPNGKTDWTVYKGKTYYFCCAGCKPRFVSNPGRYLNNNARHGPMGMMGGGCGGHGGSRRGDGCGGHRGGSCGGHSGRQKSV